ncbi:MAG: branched-chain amino acid ABC transporter permease [Kineosporiaceae bacterium]|nr:branched-chain amino acid ABC transporter permease [Kineosporiaceae bacterium]MBK7624981.1 branched-chain amino acid ABC transporter permease [Kineosporiaceae bacterium]MBK8076639.1 branched-chain amino acid ABC transporter permease [Kineosporiaceae bacterium]
MATATTPSPAGPTVSVKDAAAHARRSNLRWALGLTVAVIVLFLLYWKILPAVGGETATFFRKWLSVSAASEMVLWVIFALGLNIVVGYAGLLDLGYVAFWAIGGYVAGWFMSPFASEMMNDKSWAGLKVNFLGHPPAIEGLDRGIHLNFWLVLPIAGLICAFFGVLIGAPTLRLKSDYLALVTLGFGEIIPQIFRNGERLGSGGNFNLSNGDKGITPIDTIPTWPFSYIPGVPDQLGLRAEDLPFKFLVYCLLAAAIVFLSLRIREGRLGRAWLAIREDELAASMMGVPLMRTKLAAYAVGAFAGGIGGVAFATYVNGIYASRFDFAISIILLAMVVLGGMGNVWGVTVGALALAWINSTGLEKFGDTFNEAAGTNVNFKNYQFLLFGLILVLMMLFRREGLIPETRTKQVLAEPERGELEAVGADMEGGQS